MPVQHDGPSLGTDVLRWLATLPLGLPAATRAMLSGGAKRPTFKDRNLREVALKVSTYRADVQLRHSKKPL